jgi:hypothetical protein
MSKDTLGWVCPICSGGEDDCVCPECPECGERGNPACYREHGMMVSDFQRAHKAAVEAAQAAEGEG